jgi:putative membrane protein
MSRLLLIFLSGMLVSSLTFSQVGNPSGKMPRTPEAEPGTTAAHHGNVPDRLFVQELAKGGNAEVQFGHLAVNQGESEAVRNFGRHMVADHSEANKKLTEIARKSNITVPDGISAEHSRKFLQLQNMRGSKFDTEYINGQIKDHQQTVQLLQHEISAGQDEALKALAKELLPTVMKHLQQAQDIQKNLNGQKTGKE